MPDRAYYEERKATHEVKVDEQTCKDCHRTLTASDFYNDYLSATGLTSRCKECSSLRSRAYRYGISPEAIRERFKASGGECEICGEGLTLRTLTMDHDRSCCPTNSKTCGECFRGIVCFRCNIALGRIEDDVDRLRAMATYLEGVLS